MHEPTSGCLLPAMLKPCFRERRRERRCSMRATKSAWRIREALFEGCRRFCWSGDSTNCCATRVKYLPLVSKHQASCILCGWPERRLPIGNVRTKTKFMGLNYWCTRNLSFQCARIRPNCQARQQSNVGCICS